MSLQVLASVLPFSFMCFPSMNSLAQGSDVCRTHPQTILKIHTASELQRPDNPENFERLVTESVGAGANRIQ